MALPCLIHLLQVKKEEDGQTLGEAADYALRLGVLGRSDRGMTEERSVEVSTEASTGHDQPRLFAASH